jgi:Flp pilus assembly pilin Flp
LSLITSTFRLLTQRGIERGQTLVEYALIIAFIAIALVFTLSPMLSGGIASAFAAVVDVLAEAVDGLGSGGPS